MERTSHILVVDDNLELLDLVSRFLKKDQYRVSTAQNGRKMRSILSNSRIDLILLDVMLPGEDGLTLCRELRATSNVPIIMLTAKGEELDKVLGLKMGADDYVPKPFSTPELLARIEAVLRRSNSQVQDKLTEEVKRFGFSDWVFDTGIRELISNSNVVVPLSTGEYDLLLTFVERPGRVLSREQLLDLTRGRAAVAFDRSIDTQVSRLRRKIELEPKNPEIIKTVWGGGYVFTSKVTPL